MRFTILLLSLAFLFSVITADSDDDLNQFQERIFEMMKEDQCIYYDSESCLRGEMCSWIQTSFCGINGTYPDARECRINSKAECREHNGFWDTGYHDCLMNPQRLCKIKKECGWVIRGVCVKRSHAEFYRYVIGNMAILDKELDL